MQNTLEQAKLAKKAAIILAAIPSEKKNKALIAIAHAINRKKEEILKANKKDVEEAINSKLNPSLLMRLKLDGLKIAEIVRSVNDVAKLEDPVGKTLSAMALDDGLELYQVTCPIGVIGAIFESRPDALVQISCLCIKSGNAVMLKGGIEAKNTNRILAEIISEAIGKEGVPKNAVQLIETREEVKEMLALDDYIDLLIPRGSNELVKFIKENTKIAVLGHSSGVCHVYVDKDADINKAVKVSYDAKCQYPAVCNAMEKLIVHKDIASDFLKKIYPKYKEANVVIKGCDKTIEILNGIKRAAEPDWSCEYNDLVLDIKIVGSVDEAIGHINKYGSKHTDSIITENRTAAKKFISLVDSSSVMWNASTRFADGFRYGKGAEIGISTSKIHARGPVGLDGLVIYKYILIGNGNIVADYSGKNAKKYTHKKLKKEMKI